MTGVRHDVHKAYCAACGSMVSRQFRPGPDGRPEATCPRCGSLERHRFLSLLLGALAPDLCDLDTVVEIAPSRQSTPLLDRLGARRRISLDLGHDKRAVDALASLTALPLRDGSVDLLVCYHVLEHVPDDCSAMREIARVLSPRGIALIEVPIRSGVVTEEDPSASPDERVRRFGQSDHVRWYGDDFDDRLSAAGLSSTRVTPPTLVGDAAVEWFRLMAHEVVWVARHGTAAATPSGARRLRTQRRLRRRARRPGPDAGPPRPGARASRAAGRAARRPARAAGGAAGAAEGRACSPGSAAPHASDWIAPWVTGCI